MKFTEVEYSQRVRFTSGPLGTINPETPGNKFAEEMVNEGDEGKVVTYPGQMPDGWIAVRPDKYEHLLVPVHPGMIEKVQ